MVIIVITKQLSCFWLIVHFEILKGSDFEGAGDSFRPKENNLLNLLSKTPILSIISVKSEIVKIFMPCKNSINFTSQM
jgi:hypothetical protein